jgi:hypothetical protein
MKRLFAVPLLLAGMQFAARADNIPPGTRIEVRPDGPVVVSQCDRGRIFAAHVARDVFARDGDLAIPAGSYAEMIVRKVGPDEMTLDLESVTVNGRRYVMDAAGPQFNTDQYRQGDGLVGSIVGAIAGATGGQVEYRGGRIHVPAGSMLTFQLQAPLHIVNWADPGYTRDGNHYHHDHDWYR